MNIVYMAVFVHLVRCLEVDVQLEVISFDIKLETQKHEYKFRSLTTLADGQYNNKTNVTAEKLFRNAERINETNNNLECPSQESESKQVEAVLSDMMNQLTLVFTKVNQYILKEVTKATRKFLNAELIRRALQNRFKIANKKRSLVFDQLFNNMSQSYRYLYNTTSVQMFRSDHDDCRKVQNQRIWKLLEYSLVNLKKAIGLCMSEYLKEHTISPESELGKKVNNLLITDISQIRSKQLDTLCYKYKFCNGTLLQEFKWHV